MEEWSYRESCSKILRTPSVMLDGNIPLPHQANCIMKTLLRSQVLFAAGLASCFFASTEPSWLNGSCHASEKVPTKKSSSDNRNDNLPTAGQPNVLNNSRGRIRLAEMIKLDKFQIVTARFHYVPATEGKHDIDSSVSGASHSFISLMLPNENLTDAYLKQQPIISPDSDIELPPYHSNFLKRVDVPFSQVQVWTRDGRQLGEEEVAHRLGVADSIALIQDDFGKLPEIIARPHMKDVLSENALFVNLAPHAEDISSLHSSLPGEPQKVRVVYIVSADREEVSEYTQALEHAIRDLQIWYANELGGVTFQLNDPVVEVVKSEQLANWYYSNPAGPDKDSWGFANTLADAQKLVGAKHFDPEFIWVLYSDGPGNQGRGGAGVACLPEDDLLGLIGKHPDQPEKRRWIAGLGHEVGHAFGLPHPSDTVKDSDAIMWLGIYGKYPKRTYLTAADKKILMRSPFFFLPTGECVTSCSRLVATYQYNGGSFERYEHLGTHYWVETSQGAEAEFRFEEETGEPSDFFTLDDSARGITIQIPKAGGEAKFSSNGRKDWANLYHLTLQ